MNPVFALYLRRTAQKHTSGFAPLAGVPPILLCRWTIPPGGTPYPHACGASRGSEFNELAPHTPEGLRAPRFAAAHQHRRSRSPPTLKGIARHGSPCCAPPKANRQHVFRPICSANEVT